MAEKEIQADLGIGDKRMPNTLNFLHHAGILKHLDRTGWVKSGIPRPETISGHMYRMAIMSGFLVGDDDDCANLNRDKMMKMSIVHDLGESIIGDFTPHCPITPEEKQKREFKAIDNLAKLIPTARGNELRQLFQEYEDCKSPEAKFVMSLDKFDMLLQAYEYERRENKPLFLQPFFDSTKHFFEDGSKSHKFVTKLAIQLYEARDNNVEFTVLKP